MNLEQNKNEEFHNQKSFRSQWHTSSGSCGGFTSQRHLPWAKKVLLQEAL